MHAVSNANLTHYACLKVNNSCISVENNSDKAIAGLSFIESHLNLQQLNFLLFKQDKAN